MRLDYLRRGVWDRICIRQQISDVNFVFHSNGCIIPCISCLVWEIRRTDRRTTDVGNDCRPISYRKADQQ